MFWLICFVYLIDQMKFQNVTKLLYVNIWENINLDFCFWNQMWFLYIILKINSLLKFLFPISYAHLLDTITIQI